MARVQKSFVCQSCGASSAKWIGRCPSCGEWNTYVEEITEKPKSSSGMTSDIRKNVPVAIAEVTNEQGNRIATYDDELNRVLGGGIMPGSVVLLGGEPGIGKSTLLLQLALKQSLRTLYISGEESSFQVKDRASRIGIENSDCYILTATSLREIEEHISQVNPQLVIVDSIQTLESPYLESPPGSISQIRECASALIDIAKYRNLPVFLVGHINKDGQIAGPKVLEHMVDVVLQFEGERHNTYRILRTFKNRFGSTNEMGIYEMTGSGMRQVNNPSEILITQKEYNLSGVAIAASLEGIRPLLIETQALVSPAVFGTPQRNANGYDLRRLHMLLAVLEKKSGFRISQQDVFVNIAGGIRIEDPATDLALVSAIISSYEDIPLPQKMAFAAEVGLSGEIRAVNRIEQRIAEAEKLGFESIMISRFNQRGDAYKNAKIKVITVGKIDEAFSELFG